MPKPVDQQVLIAPKPILDGRAAFAYVYGVGIMVSDVDVWDPERVRRYIEEPGLRSVSCSISHFLGQPLDAAGRKRARDLMVEHELVGERTAVITDAALIKGALTAYAWLSGTDAKAFGSDALDAACAWAVKGTDRSPDPVREALAGCYALLGREAR